MQRAAGRGGEKGEKGDTIETGQITQPPATLSHTFNLPFIIHTHTHTHHLRLRRAQRLETTVIHWTRQIKEVRKERGEERLRGRSGIGVRVCVVCAMCCVRCEVCRIVWRRVVGANLCVQMCSTPNPQPHPHTCTLLLPPSSFITPRPPSSSLLPPSACHLPPSSLHLPPVTFLRRW